MKLNMYAIYDEAIGSVVSDSIKCFPNDRAAIRLISHALKSVEQEFMPDLQVFCLGTIDCDSGEIVSDIRKIGSAISILSTVDNDNDK